MNPFSMKMSVLNRQRWYSNHIVFLAANLALYPGHELRHISKLTVQWRRSCRRHHPVWWSHPLFSPAIIFHLCYLQHKGPEGRLVPVKTHLVGVMLCTNECIYAHLPSTYQVPSTSPTRLSSFRTTEVSTDGFKSAHKYSKLVADLFAPLECHTWLVTLKKRLCRWLEMRRRYFQNFAVDSHK